MAGLADYPVSAVLRADDYARAKKFYTEVLGLTEVGPGSSTSGGMFQAADGTRVSIYERPRMPAPQNTTLGFGVAADRLAEVVADLRARGVVFEEYDLPEIGLKTVDGIASMEGTVSAWFKDTEGNIVALGSM